MNEQQEGVTAQKEETIRPNVETASVPEEKICCTRCAAEIPGINAVCPACGFVWDATRKQNIITYFHIYCIGLVAALLNAVIQFFLQGRWLMSFAFGALTGIIGIVTYIYALMFLYQCWSLIPKKDRRAWPGQYIGFLFVPFYNLYWMFPAYYGLVKRQNALLPEGKRGNGNVVLAMLILPYVFVFFMIMVGAVTGILLVMNPGYASWLQARYLQEFTVVVFNILMIVIGYLAMLQLKNGACSLLELPPEEKSRIMMSVPGAPGTKKVPLWPVWTSGGCCGCFFFMFMAGIVAGIFGYCSNNEQRINVQCRNNMKQIGLALKMYSEDNKGQYPPYCGEKGLTMLSGKHYLPEKVLVCPNAAKSPTPDGAAYVYLGGLNSEAAPDMILAVCGTSHDVGKDTRFHVLFADGSVPEVILPGKVGYAELFQKYCVILDDRNGFTEKGKQLPPATRDYILRLLDTEQAKKPVSLRK